MVQKTPRKSSSPTPNHMDTYRKFGWCLCPRKLRATHPRPLAHPRQTIPRQRQLWKESRLFLPVGKGYFGVCSSSVCWNNLRLWGFRPYRFVKSFSGLLLWCLLPPSTTDLAKGSSCHLEQRQSSQTILAKNKKTNADWLVVFHHPSEKYANRQNGNLPQFFGMKITKNIWVATN